MAMHPDDSKCADQTEDLSILKSLLFLASPKTSDEPVDQIPNLNVAAIQAAGQWDTTSPSPCETRIDSAGTNRTVSPNELDLLMTFNSSAAASPSGSSINRGHWSSMSVNKTPQTNDRRDLYVRPSSVVPEKLALRHRQADDKLVPMKEYYDRKDFDGSLCPLDEYYTWSYAEFAVYSPSDSSSSLTKHTLASLAELSNSHGENTRRHVIPKSCSLYLVADNKDLASFLLDPLHVHAFVCLCGNCLNLHNSAKDRSSDKIRLLLKKPNASPHYSKAWVKASAGDKGQSISYDQRTGFCSLSHPTHPKSVCMLCIPGKKPPVGLDGETNVFPIRTSTTNSCGCPRTQLKRAAAVSRQHIAKKIKPAKTPARQAEPGEDEAALLLRQFSCANH